MRVADHLKMLKAPDSRDLKTFARIANNVDQWAFDKPAVEAYLTEILQSFHDAFDAQPDIFVKDIFFPNQLTLRATYARQDYVLSQFKKAKRTIKLESRQIALEQVYRSIVADLFDPYLSILVASFQLMEGTFHSFDIANLEKGELNKYEFLKKRVKPGGLLKGYFPVIRNAISHAGSHGIIRDKDHITFKNIKRGAQPGVSDTKTVSTGELSTYITQLIDLIVAIETAINIMGLDLKDVIINTPELARAFQSLMTQKQLAARRRKKDLAYGKIWHSHKLTPEAKRKYFIRLFAQGCQQNDMPAKNISFKDEFVIIQIPHQTLAGPEDKFLINRVAELINYLLLAEMFFHFQFTDFLVEELPSSGQESLQLSLKADDLKAYSLGEADIHDLMHDGKLFRDHQHQPIMVDFEKLKETELQSLKFGPKRKKR